MSEPWGWLQFDISLVGDADRPPPAPWSDLRRLVDRLRSDGRVDHAWFVRKPPGLRLRLAGTAVEERVGVDVVSWLHRAETSGAIRAWRRSTYEPELSRFGGPLGMALAHEHFDHDSALALGYEDLEEASAAALPRWAASVAITHDLVRRTTADRAEALDVWINLASALPAPDPLPERTDDPSVASVLDAEDGWCGTLPTAAGDLLRRAAAGNASFAERLDAVMASGSMTVGRRSVLVALIVFHWNRFGLGGRSLGPVLPSVVDLLRPVDGAGW